MTKHFSLMDKFYWWIAFKLPKRLVYHAYIRLHAYATCQKPWSGRHPSECTWDEAVKVWERQ